MSAPSLPPDSSPTEDSEEVLLKAARHGHSKGNHGWTPLLLASYFGHYNAAEILLTQGADVNICIPTGDTALHKAALINRLDIVQLLLRHGADVNLLNGEGKQARDLAQGDDVRRLLNSVEQQEVKAKESLFLDAARDGDIDDMKKYLLDDKKPVNVNCQDDLGNTALHCSAFRSLKQVAIFLLEHGIDPSIRNNAGLTAWDLSQSASIRSLLNVTPVRQFQQEAFRCEGPLLKRARLFGWRHTWVVLERGVLSYYPTKRDARARAKRRDYKHLADSRIVEDGRDPSLMELYFSDVQNFLQKWMLALREHADYSKSQLLEATVDDSDDEMAKLPFRSLSTIKDSFQSAKTYVHLFEDGVSKLHADFSSLVSPMQVEASLPFVQRMEQLEGTARETLQSLRHCLSLFEQQEEVRNRNLRQEQEKTRVLEEALQVLAKEHYELEVSLASGFVRQPRFYDAIDDDFYDPTSDPIDEESMSVCSSQYITPYASMSDLYAAVSDPGLMYRRLSHISEGSHANLNLLVKQNVSEPCCSTLKTSVLGGGNLTSASIGVEDSSLIGSPHGNPSLEDLDSAESHGCTRGKNSGGEEKQKMRDGAGSDKDQITEKTKLENPSVMEHQKSALKYLPSTPASSISLLLKNSSSKRTSSSGAASSQHRTTSPGSLRHEAEAPPPPCSSKTSKNCCISAPELRPLSPSEGEAAPSAGSLPKLPTNPPLATAQMKPQTPPQPEDQELKPSSPVPTPMTASTSVSPSRSPVPQNFPPATFHSSPVQMLPPGSFRTIKEKVVEVHPHRKSSIVEGTSRRVNVLPDGTIVPAHSPAYFKFRLV
ncbi:unnamed protein product [Darwinula stevensoni]|uniref:Uncharacterized protein n=1 Tax=Darwinula stevensoni TaxID=69355 RepID=A0A7R8X1Q9_9CRUS|nr:unnamed protein product [Darwinula stevensoni]CAG0880372.1 unnamed protein product [Darwinula stevensoni]